MSEYSRNPGWSPESVPPVWGRVDPWVIKQFDIEQSPESETYFIPGPDNRRLAVEASGPEDGPVIVACHGIPGYRGSLWVPWAPPWVRILRYDQPGYGYSTPNPFFRPVDSAKDVRSILDWFGVKTFSVIGRSGGAADALAVAAELEGCQRAAILAPMGPIEFMGAESWYKGLGDFNTRIFSRAFQGAQQMPYGGPEHDINYHLRTNSPLAETVRGLLYLERLTESRMDNLRRSRHVPDNPHDMSVGITNETVSAHAAALKIFGSQGRLDDIVGQMSWGFDPARITIPTWIWAAGNDQFTPHHHAEFLEARIGDTARLITEINATHFDAIRATGAAFVWCAAPENDIRR